MCATGGGPDSVTIDGGEGGTGAAPLSFSDHVSLPFQGRLRAGLLRVRAPPASPARTVFIGSGRLGFPDSSLFAFALGCDMISVGRERAMMAIGCIQAQRCHTGRCPTGVATQNKWLMRGLDPDINSHRAANYLLALRSEILALSRSCGVPHPALVTADHIRSSPSASA
ncbi:MAG: glutamate synthase-related protein [Solirubrobacterales bacterium]